MGLKTVLKIYVSMFFFLIAIAWIEPFKIVADIALGDLSCSTTVNTFIKPVCWLVRGIVVLVIGGFIAGLLWFIQDKGEPLQRA